MKALLLVLVSFGIFAYTASSEAATRVNGYYKKSTNSYVKPHYRSNRDYKFNNNWSTKGNYNPYTGSKGYKTYKYRSRW